MQECCDSLPLFYMCYTIHNGGRYQSLYLGDDF
jgi:hypothetical protein